MFTIKKLNCDAVFRKHQSRTTTMRKGKIVGDCDKLVTWYKPKTCPSCLNKEEFNALPPSITVREIYYYILIPGFRTQQVSLITTLLDKATYSTLEIVGLYGKRVQEFIDLTERLPDFGKEMNAEVERYISGMRSWIRGHLDWYSSTGHYQTAEMLTIPFTK